MIHRIPHQEHSRPRSRTSSGNYNTKQQLHQDDPLPSPSKSSVHHNNASAAAKSQSSSSSLKRLTALIGIGLVLLFCSFLLWNLNGLNSHELLKFSIHDSYSSHTSHYGQRGRRSRGGAGNGEGGSDNSVNHFTSKYVEILTRNWLLQQFKYLRRDFLPQPSYTSSPSSPITVKTKTEQAAKEAGLSLLIQPNTFVNLTSPYNPFDQRLSQGVNLWDLFPPVMNCPDLQRIGKVGEGGKWVCGLSYLQSSFGPDEPCVIYSFGVNDDISFEIELLLKTDCEIFAFDPTIGQLPIHNHLKAGSSDIVRGVQPGEEMSVTELKQRLHFEKIALSDVTGSNEQFLWSETLYDIMQRHRHSFIHLLKVDIESSEWRIFSSLFSRTKQGDVSGLPVGEILIELHYEALPTTVDFFSGLYSRHFYSVSREINLIPTLNAQKPFAAEYTFVNVNNFYGVHPPLPLSTSRLNEGENEVTSLRSHSRSNVTVPRTPVKALIYFLTQRKRLPRMCDAVQRLFENFLQHYPHYPVVIFHDDLTAADEDFLQRRCLSTAPHPPSPSDPPKREEVSVTLRFVRIDFKTPKHLTKRNVFIPTRTFCDPSHSSLGYRHMCRFHAYGVHRDLARVAKEVFRSRGKEDDVDDYYIWRLDDDSQLTAPIGYDIFRFMAMNEKLYGFVSMLKDDEKCVMGLWETSRRFFSGLNSSNSNHAFNYSDSLLPQWPNPVVIYNNFEISHSSVWRHPVWLKYRDYLDWLGGIYTLRWGDAPIHTIIVTTILDRRQIHKFSDIGYSHLPFLSQKAKGLPMPGMDPFLLLPVTCTYFQEWNCVISAESNTSSNFSFSSTAQRDDFLVSVSLVKKASSRQHQTTTDNNPNTLPLPMPSIPTIPNKERGVIFSFGEIEREDVLVQTIKNFYVQFARQFSIPFVVFYDQLSSFNESKILSALTPLMQQSNDPLYFHLLPVVLPNLTSPGADVRIEKNDKCWMNRHDKELSISLFLQRQAFDLLSGMGYQWFFRIPDHARLLMPVTYNPFGRLEAAGKKYGFMQTTSFEVSLQPCLQSLMSFVDELCGDIDDLSRQVSSSYLGGGWEGMGDAVIPALPRCSSFYSSDWDRKSLFVTGMAISHVSLWQSLFASFFFDVTHPRQSEDKALTLSEELLSSLSSSATSSKKKKRVTPSASSYQSLLTLLERMKSAHNRTIRSTVMNWGDHVIHNLILLTSTSTTEVEKLPHFYVTIGLDERSSAVQAPPAGSMKGGAGSVIESRQAQHIRSDVVPLNRIFSPQSFGWLGGDVAVSIPYPNLAETHAQILPPRRLLWLFGDTFLGMTSANRRVQEHSQMIDNSVAITTLSELDKDDVACEEREKTPLRHLLHHQYYHRLFNHDEEAEKRGSGIFLLPPQSAKDFCNVESEKASVWPIGGLFAFDSTRRLQLLVLADVSCQRRKDSSTTSSTSSAQQRLFGVETLNFHTKQQLLYRVKNPLDTPDLWSYDVVPINLNAPPSSSRTSGVVTDYAWVALAEGKGKYYADADDFLYILASAEIRGKGDETRQQHHGFFRVRAKDLLALTRAEDLTSPTSSLEILGRGGDGWQKFRPATDVIEIADLFAPVEHLFPHYRMNEASLFYDVSHNEWVLYHVNSLTLHTSYLYCSLPAKEVETRGAGFRCQYLADIEKKWLHPSVITYAGRLHPHLLHPSLNHLQMAEVVRGKVCDGKRRVMTSQVSNTATSLDLLFRDFDEKAATSENRNRKQERDVPTSSEVYVPRFVYIREI